MKINSKKQLVGRIYTNNLLIRTQNLTDCCRKTGLHLAILALLYPSFAYANPDGAQIVSGQVSIDTATPGVTTVTNSPNAIINWQNFNIAQNELTQFIQQNGQSAVLNRIIGQNPSEILGQLTSNGKVFLINPNGIVFGAGAVIDTQGLIASSLNISDQDFLSGNYHFMAGSKAGNIVNEGIIRAGKDGNIVLIAPQIQNSGIIQSDGGAITLAAGQELTITNMDNPDIRFQIQAPADSVLNLGKLLTEGGAINVFAGTIKHSGEINANSVELDAQGNIRLVAQQDISLASGSKVSANNSQGDAGAIHIESKTGATLAQGTIEAQAGQTGHSASLMTGKGGNIELLGEQVGVLDQAKIDASGKNGGGQVLIGGDYQGKNAAVHNAKAAYVGKDTTIKADAETDGNGGKVIVWSNDTTRAYGNISVKGGADSGNGGFVETSGHNYLDFQGLVDTRAPHGKNGTLLLDPTDITIDNSVDNLNGGIFNAGIFSGAAGNSILTWATINAQPGSLEIRTNSGGGGGNGDININASGVVNGPTTLTLLANRKINFANLVSVSSNSDFNLVAGWNNVGWSVNPGVDNNITFGANSSLSTTGNVWLNAGNAVSQGAGATITANTLSIGNTNGVSLPGGVNLPEANMVNTLAVDIASGGSLTFSNAKTLTIGTGPFFNGIVASDNTNPIKITTTAGNLTVAQPILSNVLGGSQITLKAANALTLNAAITSTFNATSAGSVELQAGSGGVTSNAAGIITTAALKVVSGGSVTLSSPNVVNTLAGSINGTGAEHFYFSNSSDLSIDTVNGVSGISIANFPNYTPGSSSGVIALQATGNITQTATGGLGGAAVWAASSGGSVDLTAANNGTGILSGSANGGFYYRSSNTIALMNVDGHSGISTTGIGDILLGAPGFANTLATPFSLAAASSRWLVYTANPANVAKGGLTSAFRQYSTVYGCDCAIGSGNGFIYASAPGTININTTLTSGIASNTFGTAPTAVFGYAIGNPTAVDNEDLAAIAGVANFTPTLFGTTPVGNYTVNYLNGLSSAAGYTFAAGTGLAYTVNPALLALSVTADNATRVYGVANPVFTGNITAGGLANGDTLNSIGLSYTTLATPLSNIGTYAITPKISSSNYTFTGIDGQLTVTPLASVAWTGGNGLWSTASNWANNALPTTGNVLAATIPTGVTVTYDSEAGDTKLDSLNSLGHFQMTGGTLGIKNFNTAQYTQSDGDLFADSFSVSKTFNQTGGVLTASNISISTINDLIQSPSGSINATNLKANSGGDVTLAGLNFITDVLDISAASDIFSRTKGVSIIRNLNAPNGWIDVENIGGFILGSTVFEPGTIVANATGDIMIKAMSPLTVNGAVSSSAGRVSLTASNGDTLAINAPITAANGIILAGGTLTGSEAGTYAQYFNSPVSGGTTDSTSTNDSPLSEKVTDSTAENTSVVVGTMIQPGQPLADKSNNTNNADGSSDPTAEKSKKLKQCIK